MNYLITGAAGFIGSNFVRELEKIDTTGNVIILDNLTYASSLESISDLLTSNRIEFIQGDIQNKNLIVELISQSDLIVNFAAESHVDRSIHSSDPFFATNILGTVSILEGLRQYPTKPMIQISTDEVYGSLLTGFAKETNNLEPNSPYSSSKAGADLICRSYVETYGLDVRITRCTNNYGPFQNPEKLIPKIITNLILGKKIPIYGTGENIRDWIHVSDHVNGILKVLDFGIPGGIYNIGSNNLKSNLEVARTIANLMGFEDDCIEYVPDRLGHDFRYALDYSNLESISGYRAQIDFESGIKSTISWYETAREWWEPLIYGEE